jgi:hypothetical protein
MIHFATDQEWDELADMAPVICMEIWLTLYGEEHDKELHDMMQTHGPEDEEDPQQEFDWEAPNWGDDR